MMNRDTPVPVPDWSSGTEPFRVKTEFAVVGAAGWSTRCAQKSLAQGSLRSDQVQRRKSLEGGPRTVDQFASGYEGTCLRHH